MRNTNLQAMIESAILAAFALIIDILPLSIKIPTGGSVSFAMIPIFIIAYRWGFKMAFLGGLIWGLLQIVVGDAYILTPIQACIEYFIAFAFIGFAGLFHRPIQKAISNNHYVAEAKDDVGSRKEKVTEKNNQGKKALLYIILGTFIGSFARYFCHFIAGIIFWGQYAPKGQSAFLYSFIVNGSTMLASFALCTVLLLLLYTTSPRLFQSIRAYHINSKNKSA
ncbi:MULTISPECIES: energy-coupled thiamine transporter ThiT [unclassified Bacillus cereus group]|uniref:energy-coupled thiamine transporter ThiT n=1 Tax=unclassified Bacillus cereus group TaxID=2750818 RepID=UPI001F579F6C|nr:MULTISPECIES: energy-coupled thiamine transporter ThiT [unclassified Bacillus cereus group]